MHTQVGKKRGSTRDEPPGGGSGGGGGVGSIGGGGSVGGGGSGSGGGGIGGLLDVDGEPPEDPFAVGRRAQAQLVSGRVPESALLDDSDVEVGLALFTRLSVCFSITKTFCYQKQHGNRVNSSTYATYV